MNSIEKRVGNKIREARLKLNLSQKDFGNLIGKSESQVGAYENMKTAITLEMLIKIAKVANMEVQDFFVDREKNAKKEVWDAELRIYGVEDRKQVMTILAVNGYDVGQHKKAASPTGKTMNYYVHATDRKENADTSK